MEAEYRHQNYQRCPNKKCNESCCPFHSEDCNENYSEFHAMALYQKCSGNGDCVQYQATQSPQHNCTSNMSQYIHLIYQCIAESTFIDICNSPTMTFFEVNIMFNNTRSTDDDAVSRCKCHVVSESTVHYRLVDIRFFTSSTTIEKDYNCTSGNITIGGMVITCIQHATKGFVYMRSQNFTGNLNQGSDIIQLTYNESNRPAMVWINFKGSEDNFTINCTKDSSMTAPIVTTTPSTTDTTTPKSSISNGHSTTKMSTLSKTNATYLTTTVSTSKASITSSDTSTRPDSTPISSRDASEHKISPVKDDDSKSLPIIVGVVVPIVILIAIVTVVIIVLKRRKRKPEKDANNSRDELPNGSMNRSYQSFRDSEMNSADNETHNYDSINDESIVTYSKPIKKMKGVGNVPNDKKTESRDVFSDEYDRIEFENKCTRKVPNYDSLPTMEGKTDNDTYSHESNQSKAGLSGTVSEYSHCKVIIKESPSRDQSNTNTHRSEVLRNDDYSHVDQDNDWKTGGPSYKNEEDSYNHINFDNTTNPNRNGNIESGGNLCTSKVLDENQSTIKNSTSNCDYELAKPTVN